MQFRMAMGVLVLAGCVEQTEPDGARLFAQNCASCHGMAGKGDGEMARHLIKMPPDLTTLTARNGGTFPRDAVMGTIDGLSRAPHFSGAMPEFGAAGMGDTIVVEMEGKGIPVPEDLLALTTYLEGVQG